MDEATARELLEINRRFYDEFGEAFAATRRRIQPGVSRVLNLIPRDRPSDWLDLGCGSGALGKLWAAQGRFGSYTGLDFSGPLLEEARKAAEGPGGNDLEISYLSGDLMDPKWPDRFSGKLFDGVLAFASLHHIPGAVNHLRIFSQVSELLKRGGAFIFSVWQFQNSPKLMKRVQPWSLTDVSELQLEPGDTLLDWRFDPNGKNGRNGLRYVHLFTEAEIRELAAAAGFEEPGFFCSDGAEGNLALYAVLKKPL